jgi:hypothetical protein
MMMVHEADDRMTPKIHLDLANTELMTFYCYCNYSLMDRKDGRKVYYFELTLFCLRLVS